MSWWREWNPHVLVIGSGGLKGLDLLGSVWWFWSENMLADVKDYVGCSIGGIICALMMLGYWPHEILEQAVDTTLFKDMSEIQLAGVSSEFGLISNRSFDDTLGRSLKAMIERKYGRVPSLMDLYEITGKTLHLAAASLKGRTVVYLSHLTHPDMDLLTALRYTSLMPGVFGKLEHQKDYYVDGAVVDPFPVLHLDDGKRRILALGVLDNHDWQFEKVGAMTYFDRIISMSLKRLTEFSVANASKECYCIVIPVCDEVGYTNATTREARLAKFLHGYKFTANYVLERPHYFKPVVTSSLPPLDKKVIMTCLETMSGKTLLRCMRENPELFRECVGLDVTTSTPRVEPSLPRTQPQPSATRVKKMPVAPMPMPVTVIEEDDDDIIEIPRREVDMHRSALPPLNNDRQIIVTIPSGVMNFLGAAFLRMLSLGTPPGERFMLP